MKNKHSGFSGSLGFVLAAAGSAVGVGNILALPLSLRQGRRPVPVGVSGAGADLRLHTADHGRGHRPPDQAERAERLRDSA